MEYYLGIYGSHNSALALGCRNSKGEPKILEVVELERFVNIKNGAFSFHFPIIDGNIQIRKILQSWQKKYNFSQFEEVLHDAVESDILQAIPFKRETHVMHHKAHTYNGFYHQREENALVISFDGGSGDGFFNISTFTDNQYERIGKVEIDICVPYAAVAHYLSPIKRESNWWWGNLVYPGKLMGLSSYGEYHYNYATKLEKYFRLQDRDNVNFAHENFQKVFQIDGSKRFNQRESELLAWNTQFVFEKLFKEHVTPYIEKYPHHKLIFTGGGALNIINNTKWKAFVSPNPDDRGIALGCLLTRLPIFVDSTYLGNLPYDELPLNKKRITVEEVVGWLKDGEIIGVIQGRAEHGARALGNRSIICLPYEGFKEKLNKKVKHRESYRPFGAVCREEDAEKYFETDEIDTRWMVNNVIVKSKDIPAVTHVDGTCRLQTVTKDSNKLLYEILGHIPVLINTSLNIQGKPIANTYHDALAIKGLDRVITDAFYIWK
mgnify:CR=1 FL=1